MVSFNFPPFTRGDLILQGDAEILDDGSTLTLTNPAVTGSDTGRALYKTPVRIWDGATGNVASFVTSFSFIVEDIAGFPPGDGIIFFLAPPDTKIPPYPNIPPNSGGGLLGVADAESAFNQFVGVEFDNFVNPWDPNYAHIGIDVNSLISLKTVPWKISGSLVNVSIIYESQTKTLIVAVTDENGQLISTVGQVVDLKAVLPETIWVGLSATITEVSRQIYTIKSWSFSSTSLEGGDN